MCLSISVVNDRVSVLSATIGGWLSHHTSGLLSHLIILMMAATKYSSQLEITIIYIVHNSKNQNDSKLTLGPFKCYVTVFSWEFDPTHHLVTLITLNLIPS